MKGFVGDSDKWTMNDSGLRQKKSTWMCNCRRWSPNCTDRRISDSISKSNRGCESREQRARERIQGTLKALKALNVKSEGLEEQSSLRVIISLDFEVRLSW